MLPTLASVPCQVRQPRCEAHLAWELATTSQYGKVYEQARMCVCVLVPAPVYQQYSIIISIDQQGIIGFQRKKHRCCGDVAGAAKIEIV